MANVDAETMFEDDAMLAVRNLICIINKSSDAGLGKLTGIILLL